MFVKGSYNRPAKTNVTAVKFELLSTAGEKVYNLSSAKLKNITKLNILHRNLHKPETLQYIIYNDKDII